VIEENGIEKRLCFERRLRMTKQIVMTAVLVALCGCTGLNKSPGEATDGITVRFTADKRVWSKGDDPRFKVVVRNAGTQKLTTSLIASLALEVDGKPFAPQAWYRLGVILSKPFGPGAEYKIAFSLGDFGAAHLGVGNHAIRVAYLDNLDVSDGGIITSLQGYPDMVLAFSEAVKIEIIAQSEDNTSE
jgi:hypothetical protein